MRKIDLAIGIGGAAGQGIATPGDVLARIFVRRGLHLNAYNAYQSIIRGGHIFLTLRTSDQPVFSTGDKLDVLITLNQDTMNRHLKLMQADTAVLYNSDKIKPGETADGVQLCPFSVKELAPNIKGDLVQNTIALAAILQLIGVEFKILEEILTVQFKRKGDAVVAENVGVARAGYEYATAHFKALPSSLPDTGKKLAYFEGNQALAMGGAAAGVRFYCAYPMSPSSGVLHWMARNARKLDIMVRQVEDELGVINMAIGAAHMGCRSMCATSGGGFALMSEALGSAAMMEIPVVCINVQRAGPATGVPTKTEQGDLWQALGAGQGDYPRIIVAPTSIPDCFKTIPELFNLVDKFQCPGTVLTDLLLSEGRSSVDPAELDFNVPIDRGDVIGLNGGAPPPVKGGYKRYLNTESGISPRALPGTKDYDHVVATDEHDEDGVLLTDVYTNPRKRQMAHEKRMRKMEGILKLLKDPKVSGPAEASATLVGWGSTEGVIQESIEKLSEEGIVANQLQVKWLVPLQAETITSILLRSKKIIIVENNHSGQFARYLRSETGIVGDGHIRKYDGEPFMPHHIVAGVKKILTGKTKQHVPVHEMTL